MDSEKPALVGLLLHDQDGYMIQMILRDCVRANLARQPAMCCCARTSRFLGEQVQWLQEKDLGLRVWRSYKALVRLWRANRHKEATDTLIALMLLSSPGASEAMIKEGRVFHDDGTLERWNLCHCSLTALPEEFGTVRVTRELYMSFNQLRSLPESFGNITVLHLFLNHNQIGSLPESFGNITVGGDISLGNNQIGSLPESFGNITVRGDLLLNDNLLASLPGNFGNITVGRDIFLYRNRLTRSAVPESFGGVGGELRL